MLSAWERHVGRVLRAGADDIEHAMPDETVLQAWRSQPDGSREAWARYVSRARRAENRQGFAAAVARTFANGTLSERPPRRWTIGADNAGDLFEGLT